MDMQSETAAPTAIGNGGDISQAVTAEKYRHENDNASLPFIGLGEIVAKIVLRAAAQGRSLDERPLIRAH